MNANTLPTRSSRSGRSQHLGTLPEAARLTIMLLMVSTTFPALLSVFAPFMVERVPASLTSGSVGVSVVLLLAVIRVMLPAILNEQRVINARCLPRQAMHLPPSSGRQLLLLGAALLAWPVALHSLLTAGVAPTPIAAMIAALAWSCLVLALACGAVAAWHGVLPGFVLTIALTATAVLLSQGLTATLTVLGHQSGLTLLLLAASVSSLWWTVNAVYSPRGPLATIEAASPRQALIAQWHRLKSRYKAVGAGPFFPGLLLLQQWVMLTINTKGHFLFEGWDSPVDSRSLLKLAFLVCTMYPLLVTDRLHWRLLLAPGNRTRQKLGPDIVLRSWLFASAMIAILMLLAAALDPHRSIPETWALLPGLLQRYAPTLLCDLLLATAIATSLRPTLPSVQQLLFGALAVTFLLMLLGIATYLTDLRWPLALWRHGFAHHIGVLLLAGLFTLLAQRRWARTDLRPWQLKPG